MLEYHQRALRGGKARLPHWKESAITVNLIRDTYVLKVPLEYFSQRYVEMYRKSRWASSFETGLVMMLDLAESGTESKT